MKRIRHYFGTCIAAFLLISVSGLRTHASQDIKAAIDIAGDQMYFRDDISAAEQTDTTCSDAIVTYEDISITNRDSIRAHVVLNAPYAVYIYNNDKLLSKTEMLEAGEYDFDIPTQVGENNFKVYIVDGNHSILSKAGFVEKDVVAPILQLVRDYTEIYTEDVSVTFEGKVEDYDYFTINDKEIKVEGDHTFKYECDLNEGSNIVNILAEDLAGNQSLYVATIYRIIPDEKPIPWSKIIPGVLLVVLFSLFLIDSIRKNYGLDQDKSNKKAKKDKGKDNTDSVKRTARGTKGLVTDILELVIPLSCAILIFTCVIQITTCQSGSMEPNVMTGNTVFYNKLAYKMGKYPQRGDIVNFYSDEYHVYFSKRIMGIPGDVISFQDGYVVINGQYVDESAYIDKNIESNSPKTFTVPEGCYFMLGDNRENSNDSRYWMQPFIPFENIKGKYMGQIEFSIDRNIFHTV